MEPLHESTVDLRSVPTQTCSSLRSSSAYDTAEAVFRTRRPEPELKSGSASPPARSMLLDVACGDDIE